MEHMHESMGGMPPHMLGIWLVAAAVLVFLLGFTILMARPARNVGVPFAQLASQNSRKDMFPIKNAIRPAAEATGTIFLLPDISNYTFFMTSNRFSFGHAQHIIFSLVNAMIESATHKLELSKLEGDAALFFANAGD